MKVAQRKDLTLGMGGPKIKGIGSAGSWPTGIVWDLRQCQERVWGNTESGPGLEVEEKGGEMASGIWNWEEACE